MRVSKDPAERKQEIIETAMQKDMRRHPFRILQER